LSPQSASDGVSTALGSKHEEVLETWSTSPTDSSQGAAPLRSLPSVMAKNIRSVWPSSPSAGDRKRAELAHAVTIDADEMEQPRLPSEMGIVGLPPWERDECGKPAAREAQSPKLELRKGKSSQPALCVKLGLTSSLSQAELRSYGRAVMQDNLRLIQEAMDRSRGACPSQGSASKVHPSKGSTGRGLPRQGSRAGFATSPCAKSHARGPALSRFSTSVSAPPVPPAHATCNAKSSVAGSLPQQRLELKEELQRLQHENSLLAERCAAAEAAVVAQRAALSAAEAACGSDSPAVPVMEVKMESRSEEMSTAVAAFPAESALPQPSVDTSTSVETASEKPPLRSMDRERQFKPELGGA